MVKDIPYDLRANDVDKVLIEKFGLGLLAFAQIFAAYYSKDTPWGFIRPRGMHKKADLEDLERLINNFKPNLFRAISEIEGILSGRERSSLHARKSLITNEQIEAYGLRDFFKKHYSRWEELLNLDKSLQLKATEDPRGARRNNRSAIATLWGILIENNNHKKRWGTLADLYLWFWHRLGKYECYKDLAPPTDLDSYLKIQYGRHKDKQYAQEDSWWLAQNYIGTSIFTETRASSDPIGQIWANFYDDLNETEDLEAWATHHIDILKKRVKPCEPWEIVDAFYYYAYGLWFDKCPRTKRKDWPIRIMILPDFSYFSPDF